MSRYELEQLKDEFENVQYRIEEEGIDYCFDGYSKWSEIEDEEFHELRKNYLESAKAIRNYVDERIVELNKMLRD